MIKHIRPLLYCSSIWQQTKASFQDKFGDVHTRLMKKNYDPVPQWWFYSLMILVIGLALLTCEGFGSQLQLPYWGVLLAIALAMVFTLPIGVITATTNQVCIYHDYHRLVWVHVGYFVRESVLID